MHSSTSFNWIFLKLADESGGGGGGGWGGWGGMGKLNSGGGGGMGKLNLCPLD